MFDLIYLFKTPLKPNYEKVISTLATIASQSAFASKYQTFLITNYESTSIILPTNKNVIVNGNILKITINKKYSEIDIYNYVALHSPSSPVLTFYFIEEIYTQNDSVCILTLKRDSWANSYYDLYYNVGYYKNKIIRSHLPNNFYNTKEKDFNLVHNVSPILNTNTEKLYLVNTELGTVAKRYKLLFAKIYCTNIITYHQGDGDNYFPPLETIENLYVYYLPLASLDILSQTFTKFSVNTFLQSNLLFFNDVEQVETTPLDTNTKITVYGSETLGVTDASIRIRQATNTMQWIENHSNHIVKCELTYNFPLKYIYNVGTGTYTLPGYLTSKLTLENIGDSLFQLPIICAGISPYEIVVYKYFYSTLGSGSDNNRHILDYNFTYTPSTNTFDNFLKSDFIFNNYPFNYYSFISKETIPFIKFAYDSPTYTYNNLKVITYDLVNSLFKCYRTDSTYTSLEDIKYNYLKNDTKGRLYSTENALSAYMNENTGSVALGLLGTIANSIISKNPATFITNGITEMGNILKQAKKEDTIQATGNDYITDLFVQDDFRVFYNECIIDNAVYNQLLEWYYKGHIYEYIDYITHRIRKFFDFKQTFKCELPYIHNIYDRDELEKAFDNGITIVYAMDNNDATPTVKDLSINSLINVEV